MSSLGKSIELYLMDGTSTGRWQATLSNWNCVSFKIPRGMLKDSNNLSDLHLPGVYFLFGRDDESRRKFVYVGEGDDVLKRLTQPHSFEKDGSYWTEAVIHVTPDNTLDKGKIKYLENRFYCIINDAKRYVIKNGNVPTKSQLPQKTQDLLEEFIINSQLVMPALGHKVFEPQPSMVNGIDEDGELLFFSRNKGKSGKAYGKIADDGFWVLKGSYICPDIASYLPSGLKHARKQYAGIINKEGILQEDVVFGSPSYASSFVCGKNSNGLTEWKTKDGVTLKELNEGIELPSKKKKKKKDEAINPHNIKILHLKSTIKAYGYVSGKEFIVIKNSQVCENERPSCRESIKKQRRRLIENGEIKDGLFTKDTTFSSPSAAAACIIGGEANGKIMWANEEGVLLKDL